MDKLEYVSAIQQAAEDREEAEAEAARQPIEAETGMTKASAIRADRGMDVAWRQAQAEHGGPEAGQ